MALDKLPSNLYSGNAVVVNAMPYVQYADKLKREKAAKEEALDKYYQNMPNTLNSKGMRDQDIPGLHERQNEIQQYWAANRDAIRKGNTPEAFNLGKMFRETQGAIDQSKNRAATSLLLGKARLDPKKQYMFRGQDREAALLAHEEPVWNPEAKGIDLTTYDVPPPPLQQKDLIRLTADIKPGVRTSTKPHPTDKYKEIEVSTPYLDPKQLDDIQKRAATALHNNWSFEEEIKNKLSQTPEIKEKLDLVFKNNYGRLPQSQEDVAAAYLLSNMGNLAETEKPRPNWKAREDLKWGRKLDFNKLTFGQSLTKIRANKSGDGSGEDEVRYITDENVEKHGKEFPKELEVQAEKSFGFKPVGYIEAKDIDVRDFDVIRGFDKSKGQPGVNPIEFEGKEVYLIQDDGNWVGSDGKVIDREAVKDSWLKGKTKQTITIGSKGQRGTKADIPVIKEKKKIAGW